MFQTLHLLRACCHCSPYQPHEPFPGLLLLEEDGGVVEQTLQGSQALRPLPPLLHTEEEVPTKLLQLQKLVLQLLQTGETAMETISLPTV